MERFRRLRRLGAGGMGVVYEALDLERGDKIAMKTLLRSDGEALLRFKREFRAFQDIEHPNLVRLYELLEVAGEWFFTMELVEGVDFVTFVRPSAAGTSVPPSGVDVARLRDALGQLALGIAALHGAGKIHRDIKPSNAMVTAEGRVVVLDLGLVADRSADAPSSAHNLVGTPSYMAPEQALGQSGTASDWYAMGAMMFHALTGQLPFTGAPFDVLMQKQEHEAPAASTIVDGIPADLDSLCSELMLRDPDARPDVRAIMRRLNMSVAAEVLASSRSIEQRFVGRAAELGALDDAYAGAVSGGTVTVVLHGRSGVGKSALIREFAHRVRRAEHGTAPLVLVGRCFENESLSYNAFDGVIDALSTHLCSYAHARAVLPDDASLLVRAFPVLARVEAMASAPLSSEANDPDELRTRMLAALRQMFRRLAERSPVIITVDDVQWANRDSLLLLAEITRPPYSPPLLMLLSARGASNPDLGLLGDVRPVAVEPLVALDARELARSLLAGVGMPLDQADEIADEAEGHPMHIDALIRYAAHTPENRGLPKLDQAIVARADQLHDDARRVLDLACLAGAPVTRAVMARAASLEGRDFERAFAALRLHNLARASGVRRTDVVEPYHDRVRESVAAALDPDAAIAYHTRLAVALESAGSDPELLMRHQAACGESDKAAVTALRAAEAATDALAFDRAAELYNISLRLREPAPEQRRDIHWRLSEALANAGRGDEAAASYMTAADGADKAMRLECYHRAAEHWLKTGHIDRGLDTLRQLLGQINASYPATPRGAMASLLFTRALLRLRGLGWKRRDVSEIGREQLTRVDVYRTVGQGIGMVDTIRGAAFQARGLLLALRAGEPSRVGRAFALEAIFLASQGRRSIIRARKLLARTNELSGEDSDVAAWAVSSDGVIAYFEGRFEDAVATLRRALELWREQTAGHTWEKNNVLVFQLLSLRLLGRVGDLYQLAREQIRYARRIGDRYLETSVRRITNLAWLCRDEPDSARASLEETQWAPPEGGFHLQHWWENEASSELALYEGSAVAVMDSAMAKLAELRRSLLTRVEIVRIMSMWLDGRLHLAAAHADPSLLINARRAARALERESAGYAAGFAHLLRAGLCERDADTAGALVHYRQLEGSTMTLAMWVARRRVAELEADAAGVAVADDELRTLGVVAPDRVGRLFAVGWGVPG